MAVGAEGERVFLTQQQPAVALAVEVLWRRRTDGGPRLRWPLLGLITAYAAWSVVAGLASSTFLLIMAAAFALFTASLAVLSWSVNALTACSPSDTGGVPAFVTIQAPLSGWQDNLNYNLGIFAQDDWKVNRALTVFLGVRYEVYSPLKPRNPGDVQAASAAIPVPCSRASARVR